MLGSSKRWAILSLLPLVALSSVDVSSARIAAAGVALGLFGLCRQRTWGVLVLSAVAAFLVAGAGTLALDMIADGVTQRTWFTGGVPDLTMVAEMPADLELVEPEVLPALLGHGLAAIALGAAVRPFLHPIGRFLRWG